MPPGSAWKFVGLSNNPAPGLAKVLAAGLGSPARRQPRMAAATARACFPHEVGARPSPGEAGWKLPCPVKLLETVGEAALPRPKTARAPYFENAPSSHTSSGLSCFFGGWPHGLPSAVSGYSKTLPSKLRISTRPALRQSTYSGLIGTLPPPPGASIT